MNGCILSCLSWKVPQVDVYWVGVKLALCLPLDCFVSKPKNWAHRDVSQFWFLLLAQNSLNFPYRYIYEALINIFLCSLKYSGEQSPECKGLNSWGKLYHRCLEKHLQSTLWNDEVCFPHTPTRDTSCTVCLMNSVVDWSRVVSLEMCYRNKGSERRFF